ncbi:hypothetical protein AB0O57_32355 [Streptomyces sp. NPDC091201]|uniref:hypothetical protein n=1 Tax=Streptomyces sp. NPDC091201 TaxID=3155190 RepID=UPI00342E6699
MTVNADDLLVVTIAPYPGMAAGDTVVLYWSTVAITNSVESAQVGKPLSVTVPYEVIEQAGAGSVYVTYQVHTSSGSTGLAPYSVTESEVGTNLLRAPNALDAVDGAIDLDQLNGQDARVRVRVYPDMSEGDRIALTWESVCPYTQEQEGAVATHTYDTVVDADAEGLAVEFAIPNAIFAAAADGLGALRYTVTSNRGHLHSRVHSIRVTGGQP